MLRAPGKLLISGEYMVMHGSQALALPLNPGQTLQRIKSGDRRSFSWHAFWNDKPWFHADFDPFTLDILETTDRAKAGYLQRLLRACVDLDPQFQKELSLWDVKTRLDFSPAWGLGSSSSLTVLMAQWAEIHPLDLHFRISEGSGCDVACAMTGKPVVYSLREDGPQVRPVSFHPAFADQIYFVWLGSKQPTASHLAELDGRFHPGFEDILRFSGFTRGMLEAVELRDFRMLMEEHEARLSELTGWERVSTRFPGLQGSVKSLGAWGGDFVMIASEQNQAALFHYLDGLGLKTRFGYKDLVYGS